MSRSLSTELIHHAYRAPAGFDAVAPGVYKASTVFFGNVNELRNREWRDKSGYTYGLHGTPTTFTLEERIATLEGGAHCVLVPSGLAAVSLVDMAFLRQGDELLVPDNAYGPNKSFAEAELRAWGITTRYYDAMNPADLAAKLTDATRLVWLESPGSITLEFPDVPALVAVVNAANERRTGEQGTARRTIVTALDNTWGAGIAFNAFELGVDISMQALTKYPSGGADVLMGSVVTREARLHQTLLMTHMRLGHGVAGNDTELVLRGLPSIALRYSRARRCHPSLGHLDAGEARGCTGVAPSHPRLTRPRSLVAGCHGGCVPVQRGVQSKYSAVGHRPLLRCADAVPVGLELGRAHQPLRPV
jgi:cystathionine beta-lyase